MNCCWPGDVCGIGEGDCDFDVDCAAGLKCGSDNCYHDFRTTDIRNNWDVMADCCYGNNFSIINFHIFNIALCIRYQMKYPNN